MDKQRQIKGFTLLELMMAISILAITMALVVPGFATMVKKYRLQAQYNELVAYFNMARSEAAKRGWRVNICASTDHKTCSGDVNDWQAGWLIYAVNPNGANPNQYSLGSGTTDGDVLLRSGAPKQGEIVVAMNDDGDNKAVANIFYLADGSTSQAIQLDIFDDRGFDQGISLVLNRSGLPRALHHKPDAY